MQQMQTKDGELQMRGQCDNDATQTQGMEETRTRALCYFRNWTLNSEINGYLSILIIYIEKNMLPYCCHAKMSKSLVVCVVVWHISHVICGQIGWPYCWLNFCFLPCVWTYKRRNQIANGKWSYIWMYER